MSFADLMQNLSLSTVEAFSTKYPEGSFVGVIEKSRIEDKKDGSGKYWVLSLKPSEGQKVSYAYAYFMDIPLGDANTWSEQPEMRRDGTPGKSEKEKKLLMARRIATTMEWLEVDVNSRDAFSPEQAEGIPVAWKIYHDKNGYVRLDHIKVLKQNQQQNQAPQYFPQPQAPQSIKQAQAPIQPAQPQQSEFTNMVQSEWAADPVQPAQFQPTQPQQTANQFQNPFA